VSVSGRGEQILADLARLRPVTGGQGVGIQPFKGDLAELLLYNTSLAATDRQDINEYFFAKYSIPEPGTAVLFVAALLFSRRR
jgi:hypothetical protein